MEAVSGGLMEDTGSLGTIVVAGRGIGVVAAAQLFESIQVNPRSYHWIGSGSGSIYATAVLMHATGPAGLVELLRSKNFLGGMFDLLSSYILHQPKYKIKSLVDMLDTVYKGAYLDGLPPDSQLTIIATPLSFNNLTTTVPSFLTTKDHISCAVAVARSAARPVYYEGLQDHKSLSAFFDGAISSNCPVSAQFATRPLEQPSRFIVVNSERCFKSRFEQPLYPDGFIEMKEALERNVFELVADEASVWVCLPQCSEHLFDDDSKEALDDYVDSGKRAFDIYQERLTNALSSKERKARPIHPLFPIAAPVTPVKVIRYVSPSETMLALFLESAAETIDVLRELSQASDKLTPKAQFCYFCGSQIGAVAAAALAYGYSFLDAVTLVENYDSIGRKDHNHRKNSRKRLKFLQKQFGSVIFTDRMPFSMVVGNWRPSSRSAQQRIGLFGGRSPLAPEGVASPSAFYANHFKTPGSRVATLLAGATARIGVWTPVEAKDSKGAIWNLVDPEYTGLFGHLLYGKRLFRVSSANIFCTKPLEYASGTIARLCSPGAGLHAWMDSVTSLAALCVRADVPLDLASVKNVLGSDRVQLHIVESSSPWVLGSIYDCLKFLPRYQEADRIMLKDKEFVQEYHRNAWSIVGQGEVLPDFSIAGQARRENALPASVWLQAQRLTLKSLNIADPPSFSWLKSLREVTLFDVKIEGDLLALPYTVRSLTLDTLEIRALPLAVQLEFLRMARCQFSSFSLQHFIRHQRALLRLEVASCEFSEPFPAVRMGSCLNYLSCEQLILKPDLVKKFFHTLLEESTCPPLKHLSWTTNEKGDWPDALEWDIMKNCTIFITTLSNGETIRLEPVSPHFTYSTKSLQRSSDVRR